MNNIENKIINLLNELLEIDPGSIHSLLCTRVPCSEKLIEHPSFEVTGQPFNNEMNYYYGLFNILNYLLEDSRIGIEWEQSELLTKEGVNYNQPSKFILIPKIESD
jgi:hypothetical protein